MLPDISHDNFTDTLYIKTNDQMLVVYLASLVRSIIALHNLINNKLTNRESEETKPSGDVKDKDKDSKDKKDKDAKDDKKTDKTEKEKEKKK